MKIKQIVIALLAMSVIAVTVFVVSKDETPPQQNTYEPTNSNSSSEPSYSGSKTNSSEDLEECVRQASIKDSPQNLIDEAIQACYDKYR